MRHPQNRLIAVVQGLVLAFGICTLAQAQQQKAARPDMVLKADGKCTRCHDETEDYPVLAIGKTKHGTLADGRTPTCTNCHGESDTHANKPENVKERPAPERAFGKHSKTPWAARNEACLTCHQSSNRMNWQSSMHASRDVACTSCHKVHAAHDPVRDKLTQTNTCFTCHKEQRNQMVRFSHHPVAEGKMGCSSCHNVHGDNPKQLVKASVTETCFTCHMEKRGPFLHNHQPVQENCAICHNPHGSNIANLLLQRPPFLCQECHSHTSHPSQASGLPTGRTSSTSALGSVARGCPNCHINIHGGNSMLNNATAGRFRR